MLLKKLRQEDCLNQAFEASLLHTERAVYHTKSVVLDLYNAVPL